MRLVRLKKIDKLARNSNDIRLMNEYRKLRNELLNESPKYDRGKANREVKSMSGTILKHLCKMWLFFASEKSVNKWVSELVDKYPHAPTYGDNEVVLDTDSVIEQLWGESTQRMVYNYLDDLSDPDISPQYKKLPRRSNYLAYVADFIERLDNFYPEYAEALVKAGSIVASKSRLEARVGRKSYRNMGKMARKKLQSSESAISEESFRSALDNSNLLHGYGDDEYEYLKDWDNY